MLRVCGLAPSSTIENCKSFAGKLSTKPSTTSFSLSSQAFKRPSIEVRTMRRLSPLLNAHSVASTPSSLKIAACNLPHW